MLTSMAEDCRAPNWRKWRHVLSATVCEAVALSLNIDPEKLRRNPRAWMGGKRFYEDQEFLDRLFVANRNLDSIGPLNSMGMHYDDEDPVVNLHAFAAWAASIGWDMPAELSGPAAAPSERRPGCSAWGGSTGRGRTAAQGRFGG